MEAFVIGILLVALVGMGVLFVRERWARMEEVKKLTAQRKELRGWLNQRITKDEADVQRWAAMHQAYRAGWNDAVAASKAADEAEAQALAVKAAAKAKAKAERLTMK